MRILFIAISLLFYQFVYAQEYGTGMLFDDEQYAQTAEKANLSTRSLGKAIPSHVSLKKYAPYPKSQGQTGTCVAWATAYAARTIVEAQKNNWTDRDLITEKAFSPGFLYAQIKRKDDYSCQLGSYIGNALSIVKTKGLPYYSTADELCYSSLQSQWFAEAKDYKIQNYATLFRRDDANTYKIQRVQKSLAEGNPVIIGMIVTRSFYSAGEQWIPKETPQNSLGGHAMAVIGYDNNKFGGAFEIQNSWGQNWGNKGYTWVTYRDFADYTKYAFEMVNLGTGKSKTQFQGSIEYMMADGTVMSVYRNNDIYVMKKSYSSGTKFRIYVANKQPAFVYAIGTDATDKVFKLFPYNNKISPALNYSENEIPLPDDNHFIQMDNTIGDDYLCVIYSKKELDIELLSNKIENASGDFLAKIKSVLGNDLIDETKINYNSNTISFSATDKIGKIAILMVKIKHIP